MFTAIVVIAVTISALAIGGGLAAYVYNNKRKSKIEPNLEIVERMEPEVGVEKEKVEKRKGSKNNSSAAGKESSVVPQPQAQLGAEPQKTEALAQ